MNTTTGIAVAIAIIAVAFMFFGQPVLALLNGANNRLPVKQGAVSASKTATLSTSSATPAPAQPSSSADKLSTTDSVVGTGAAAKLGDTVAILYKGSLQNGTVFDSSEAHKNKPLIFALGSHKVIPGMEQGIVGMKVGGTRIIVIPPALGYGARGYGPIPSNETITFKVQLLGIKPVTK